MKWGCCRNGGARPAQQLVWGAAVVVEEARAVVIGGGVVMVIMAHGSIGGYTRHVSWRYVVIYQHPPSWLCSCQW